MLFRWGVNHPLSESRTPSHVFPPRLLLPLALINLAHMHTSNITVLQEEAQRLIALERDILEQMLSEPRILGEPGKGSRATFTRKQTSFDLETLHGEHLKLQQLELVIAVVGTMKAGKSTTINAIVGTEVLPNRNRPMTAIPTLIRHTPGQVEPILEFDNNGPIEALMVHLRKAADHSGNRSLVQRLQADRDMAAVLQQLDAGEAFPTRYRGAEAIFGFLRTLNDLVRLSAALNVPFPFSDYDEVHEIPVIQVEFAHLQGTDQSQGTLTLLDTPGPNEAGQPHLRKMLSQQLAKASAVLAVLDFTQLKSEADAQIQAELKEIASVAQGRMYALVNKFDEADRNSDSPDEVRRFVADELTEGRIPTGCIFPVSSRRAYLANRARTTLATEQALPSADQHPWVADFGVEAFGGRWAKLIGDSGHVKEAAADLWEQSMFEAPVNGIIRFAQRRAAILALSSAASKLLDTATRLANFFNTRETALGKSSQELQDQIEALQSDIDRVEESEADARKVANATLKDLKKDSDTMMKQVKSEVSIAIEHIFKERKKEEEEKAASKREAMAAAAGNSMSIFAMLAGAFKGAARDHERSDTPYFDPTTPVMRFTSRSEAEAKLAAVHKELNRIIQAGESSMKDSMSSALDSFQQNFTENVLARARLIIDEMRSRLKDDGFDLRLDIPEAATLSLPAGGAQLMGELIAEKTESQTKSRRQSGVWGTVCSWFGTDDWGWEDYSVNVDVYEIDSRAIRKAVGKDIDAVFEGLDEALVEKIRTPLQKGIDRFFHQFRETVEHIRGDLLQGQEDKRRTRTEQEELLRCLANLKKNLPAIQSDTDGLNRDVNEGLGLGGKALA